MSDNWGGFAGDSGVTEGSVVAGDVVTYTITFTNNTGASDSVPVNEVITGGLTNVGWSLVPNDPNPTPGVLPATVTVPIDGITYYVTGTVALNATGVITNALQVTEDAGVGISPGIVDNILPPVSLSITDNTTSVQAGSLDTYTITVTNNTAAALTGVKLVETVPKLDNITWVGSDLSHGSGALPTAVNIQANSSITYTVTRRVDIAATPGTQLTNTVNATLWDGTVITPATDADTITPPDAPGDS
jgi:uncharacterized repeat protein (TIGR01451 family)